MPQDTGSATDMPEIVIDRTGTPDRRIMIVDSFGQRVQMSIDQFRTLAAEGVSERFLKIASLQAQGQRSFGSVTGRDTLRCVESGVWLERAGRVLPSSM